MVIMLLSKPIVIGRIWWVYKQWGPDIDSAFKEACTLFQFLEAWYSSTRRYSPGAWLWERVAWGYQAKFVINRDSVCGWVCVCVHVSPKVIERITTKHTLFQFSEAWYSVHQEVLSWGLALGEGSLGLPGQICHQQRLCVHVCMGTCMHHQKV